MVWGDGRVLSNLSLFEDVSITAHPLLRLYYGAPATEAPSLAEAPSRRTSHRDPVTKTHHRGIYHRGTYLSNPPHHQSHHRILRTSPSISAWICHVLPLHPSLPSRIHTLFSHTARSPRGGYPMRSNPLFLLFCILAGVDIQDGRGCTSPLSSALHKLYAWYYR